MRGTTSAIFFAYFIYDCSKLLIKGKVTDVAKGASNADTNPPACRSFLCFFKLVRFTRFRRCFLKRRNCNFVFCADFRRTLPLKTFCAHSQRLQTRPGFALIMIAFVNFPSTFVSSCRHNAFRFIREDILNDLDFDEQRFLCIWNVCILNLVREDIGAKTEIFGSFLFQVDEEISIRAFR